MDATNESRPSVGKIQSFGLIAAVVGALALGAGAFLGGGEHASTTFFRAYIYGWSFWSGVSIAALGVLMLHHMVGGNWGYVMRRFLEAGAMAIPVFSLLFLPILFLGMHDLYEWTHESAASDGVLRQKLWYLNTGFFWVRWLVYFVFFSGLAIVLNAKSSKLDAEPTIGNVRSVKAISSIGTFFYVLIITFYYVDVLMSLTPHWYSTIFGIMMMVGQSLAVFSICVILLNFYRDESPFVEVLTRQHFHDIGNLMLAFTMLWTYMAFSQYLISWSGNLPEEAEWYEPRTLGPWKLVSLAVMLFAFAVPFFLLLQRSIKRRGPALAAVAAGIIVMRHVDLLWILQPSFEHHDHAHQIHGSPMIFVGYLGSTLLFGGIFFFVLALFAARKPLLPRFKSHVEPRLVTGTEAVHHG